MLLQRDPLGKDVLLKDGALTILANDYTLNTGMDNIYQAVYNRLNEQRYRQIRDEVYGIVAEIGEALDSDASFEFMAVSLKETLLADPRITEVYDLSFVVDGSAVYLMFKFNTIDGDAIQYKDKI